MSLKLLVTVRFLEREEGKDLIRLDSGGNCGCVKIWSLSWRSMMLEASLEVLISAILLKLHQP
jgi:hypothetical protein